MTAPNWTIKGLVKNVRDATDRIKTAEIIPMTPRYEEFDLNAIAGEILDAQKLVRVSKDEVAKAELALDAAMDAQTKRIAECAELESRLVDILVRMGVLEIGDKLEDVPTIIVTPPPLPESENG